MKIPHTIWSMICLSSLSTTVVADMVWMKKAEHPLYGWVISQTDTSIVFREYESDDSDHFEVKRDDILTLVVNIDHQRLQSLHPPNWSAYRDFAEELAAQKRDPTARQLAVRLFLIAANGSRGELQQSCLSGLVALAEDQSQRTKLQTLQRLINPSVNFNLDSRQHSQAEADPLETAIALEIVRLIRRGEGEHALKRMAVASQVSSLKPWRELVSIDQLKHMANQEQLTRVQLHRLLRMELALVDATLNVAHDDHRQFPTQPENWAELAQESAASMPEIPDFKNITPFDPAASIYRGNRWVQP